MTPKTLMTLIGLALLSHKALAASGSLGFSYERSVAKESDAYFSQGYGTSLALAQDIGSCQLSASTSFNRDIGATEEKWLANNSSLSLAFPAFAFSDDLKLNGRLNLTAPTHEADRSYLSYRGSVGGNIGLSYQYKRWTLQSFAQLSRSFFEYGSNRAGIPNRYWTARLGLGASYALAEKWDLSASFSDGKAMPKKGGRGTRTFNSNFGLAYTANKLWAFSLRQESSDRTTNYDRTTSNISLYDSTISSVVGSATYSF